MRERFAEAIGGASLLTDAGPPRPPDLFEALFHLASAIVSSSGFKYFRV